MGTLCRGKELQSETETVLAEVPAERGRAHEDVRKCHGLGARAGGKAEMPLQVAG
jgi:hypothetical protein